MQFYRFVWGPLWHCLLKRAVQLKFKLNLINHCHHSILCLGLKSYNVRVAWSRSVFCLFPGNAQNFKNFWVPPVGLWRCSPAGGWCHFLPNTGCGGVPGLGTCLQSANGYGCRWVPAPAVDSGSGRLRAPGLRCCCSAGTSSEGGPGVRDPVLWSDLWHYPGGRWSTQRQPREKRRDMRRKRRMQILKKKNIINDE